MRQQTVDPFHSSQFSLLVFIPLWCKVTLKRFLCDIIYDSLSTLFEVKQWRKNFQQKTLKSNGGEWVPTGNFPGELDSKWRKIWQVTRYMLTCTYCLPKKKEKKWGVVWHKWEKVNFYEKVGRGKTIKRKLFQQWMASGFLTTMSFWVRSGLDCSLYRWRLFVYFAFFSTRLVNKILKSNQIEDNVK